jgi:dihydropyrimidinase
LRGRITLEQAVRLISGAPARLFGLWGRKGAIMPGADADLCLYDPRPETIFTREMMRSQAADVDKLYAGMAFQGRVAATIARGRVVFRDGVVLAERGSGAFLAP